MNSAINVVNDTSIIGSNNVLYLAFVGLAIVGIVYFYIYYKKPEASTPYLSETGELQVTPQLPAPAVSSPQSDSWCLVAEDMSGRYCVKVPGPDSCEPGRTYSSQKDCELTPAMRLPAGIQQNSGMTEKPFRDVKVR